ncbi:MAG: sulfotransferase family protein [Solirubrobacteraceae bacterium]
MTGAGSATPSPEGVVILGMHRSGTSLITRLVSLLGLALCRHDDLLVGLATNPRGHWESRSLLGFNDQLLAELEGTWFCPPLLDPEELPAMLRTHASRALAVLQHAYPERPWVWKDPRTCVLLPFWSAVLEQRAAYVLVVRHPFEVSDSLARRNGCTPLLSLALWERYTRQAMLGASGRPLMVCTYDGVLADPAAWCERLVAFLGELGIATRAVDQVATGAFTMDGLRHSHQSWTELQPGPLISPEQVALAHAASTFTVQRSFLPPALPAETPQTESVFSEIRRHLASQKPNKRRLAVLPAHLVTATSPAPNPKEASRPPVSVVVAQSGTAAIQAAVLSLGPTLPAGSEMLIVGAGEAHGSDWSGLGEISLRDIDCDPSPSEAEALALGVQAAGGRIVLLTTGSLLRCDPWYEPVRNVLAVPNVAGVGPVMRFNSCPDLHHFGRAFTDEDLASRFVAGQPEETLMPAALLFGAHSAYNRAMLAAAGGIDKDFSSACAAVAELSLRLWRMGFRCCILPHVEAWSEAADADDAADDGGLYDRLRIATLHFSSPRLQAFTDRASHLPSYDRAAKRLAASDVELRRAAIEAVCAFPIDQYFDDFPLPRTSSAPWRKVLGGVQRRAAGWTQGARARRA